MLIIATMYTLLCDHPSKTVCNETTYTSLLCICLVIEQDQRRQLLSNGGHYEIQEDFLDQQPV